MAAALAAVLVLLHGSAPAADVVTGALEVICMACSAERRIARIGPRNRAADRIAMAGGTPRVPSVVAGIFAPRIVAKDVRSPAGGRVADVALLCCTYMEARFGRCTTARTVTVTAAAGRA